MGVRARCARAAREHAQPRERALVVRFFTLKIGLETLASPLGSSIEAWHVL